VVRSVAVGLVPYVVMLAGIPFFNSATQVGPLPLLGLWIGGWVLLSPLFLLLAHWLLPAAERQDGQP
jgi:hypothetical protein